MTTENADAKPDAKPGAKPDTKTALLTILTLVVVLLIAIEYAKLHSKYDWVFSWYATYLNSAPKGADVNIGPTRAVLAYERPWVANLMTRPLTQSGAEFLLRLIKAKIPAQILLMAPSAVYGGAPSTYIDSLKALVASADTWQSPRNLLFSSGAIPWSSDLVQGYIHQVTPKPGDIGDLSLELLWLHGYEEYIRERFTWAATSVMSEWNYMFAIHLPVPVIPPPNPCNPSTMATSAISMGMGAAGIGAMVSGPYAPLGALIGFCAGGLISLLMKPKCL